MDYEVTLDGRPAGKAQVTRQGLYYHVVCRCAVSGEEMYRLEASCGEKRLDLGILIPRDSGFGLDMRFPVSRLGEGAFVFRLRGKDEPRESRRFVPVKPEEPFSYLASLKDSVLEIRDGQMGISLPPDPME